LQDNWWIVLLMLIPSIVFLLLIVRNPAVMMIDDYWGENVRQIKKSTQLKKLKKTSKREHEATLNELLDKINQGGIDSLSANERKRLDELKDKL
jgi:hypothetical protein